MASKSMNSTIITVGVLALVGYLAYKSLPTLLKKLKGTTGATGAAGAPAPGYYGPANQQPQAQNPFQQALSALNNAFPGNSGNRASGSSPQEVAPTLDVAGATVHPLALDTNQADADLTSNIDAESNQILTQMAADNGPTNLAAIAEANYAAANPGSTMTISQDGSTATNSTPSGSILGSTQVAQLDQYQFAQALDTSASAAQGISLPDQDLPGTNGYDAEADGDNSDNTSSGDDNSDGNESGGNDGGDGGSDYGGSDDSDVDA
jgi:hypothetical protein